MWLGGWVTRCGWDVGWLGEKKKKSWWLGWPGGWYAGKEITIQKKNLFKTKIWSIKFFIDLWTWKCCAGVVVWEEEKKNKVSNVPKPTVSFYRLRFNVFQSVAQLHWLYPDVSIPQNLIDSAYRTFDTKKVRIPQRNCAHACVKQIYALTIMC